MSQLAVVRKIEERGVIETAQRVLQRIGSVMRFAITTGQAETVPTHKLSETLTEVNAGHRHAVPREALPELSQAGSRARERPKPHWAASATRHNQAARAPSTDLEHLHPLLGLIRIPTQPITSSSTHYPPNVPPHLIGQGHQLPRSRPQSITCRAVGPYGEIRGVPAIQPLR